MRTLESHKVNPANDTITVTVLDEPGPGGANHRYMIELPPPKGSPDSCHPLCTVIEFQNGGIADAGVNGVTHEVLLSIVEDRLLSFQRGPFACRENALALTKLQESLMWLKERTRGRMERGVEGTLTK